MLKRPARRAKDLKGFLRDEGATTAIEYSLIAGCLSLAIIGVAGLVGDALVDSYYNKVLEAFQSANSGD